MVGTMSAQAAEPLLTGPQVEAKSAVVMEALTGRMVFAQNQELQLPMASTTKIMTTLLTLEQKNLDRPFEVDSVAIRVEGSSMGLQEGDTVTLRTLCYGMMLASGNDAANAAAVKTAGSIEAFVDQMNQRAEQLGMKNTCFETPSGLDASGHQSTAYDLALLMRAALQVPEFCEITSTKTARLEYGNPPYSRSMTNHNKLLWNCEGVVAGKTGFTKEAGRCLVSAAKREGVTLICVTLGCPDDWKVHDRLYDQCFELMQPVEVAESEQWLVPVAGGTEPAKVVFSKDLVLPLTKEEAQTLEEKVLLPRFVYAPVKRGQILGELQCSTQNGFFYSYSLVAQNEVGLAAVSTERSGNWWKKLMKRINYK